MACKAVRALGEYIARSSLQKTFGFKYSKATKWIQGMLNRLTLTSSKLTKQYESWRVTNHLTWSLYTHYIPLILPAWWTWSSCKHIFQKSSNISRETPVLIKHNILRTAQCNTACSEKNTLRTLLNKKLNKCNQFDFASKQAGHLRTHIMHLCIISGKQSEDSENTYIRNDTV